MGDRKALKRSILYCNNELMRVAFTNLKSRNHFLNKLAVNSYFFAAPELPIFIFKNEFVGFQCP